MRALRNAESYRFLKVPLPVPPMIEDAFRYRGDEQYVSLGFGVHGGRMSDFVGDGLAPRSPHLYRSFLLHPAIKSYTEAFKIEAAPPDWLEAMSIDETDLRLEPFEAWSETARCLLLDRKFRQFFVGTVSRVRTWLILRPILNPCRKRCSPTPAVNKIAKVAEEALWAWLDNQPSPSLSVEFIQQWERQFREQQAVSGCIAAGFKLGSMLGR